MTDFPDEDQSDQPITGADWGYENHTADVVRWLRRLINTAGGFKLGGRPFKLIDWVIFWKSDSRHYYTTFEMSDGYRYRLTISIDVHRDRGAKGR